MRFSFSMKCSVLIVTLMLMLSGCGDKEKPAITKVEEDPSPHGVPNEKTGEIEKFSGNLALDELHMTLDPDMAFSLRCTSQKNDRSEINLFQFKNTEAIIVYLPPQSFNRIILKRDESDDTHYSYLITKRFEPGADRIESIRIKRDTLVLSHQYTIFDVRGKSIEAADTFACEKLNPLDESAAYKNAQALFDKALAAKTQKLENTERDKQRKANEQIKNNKI